MEGCSSKTTHGEEDIVLLSNELVFNPFMSGIWELVKQGNGVKQKVCSIESYKMKCSDGDLAYLH